MTGPRKPIRKGELVRLQKQLDAAYRRDRRRLVREANGQLTAVVNGLLKAAWRAGYHTAMSAVVGLSVAKSRADHAAEE